MGLDTVELVMAFEESFGIKIPNAAAETLLTPGDVIDHVIAQLQARGENPDREAVAGTVRTCVLDQLGISPKRYQEDARFVEDFGAD
jgi:acyl carrier protein